MAHLTRRHFHRTALGVAAAAVAPLDALAASPEVLLARKGTARLAPPEYPETAIWGYGGAVPGPVLRETQGGRLSRRFVNELPQPSSVHWHGIRIDNAMDGVVGMTQPAVAPGEVFDYDFALPDAGTYWYHPHDRTYEQMARGLYGALIVDEAEGAPDVDADLVLLLDDWRLTNEAQIAAGFGNLRDWSHAGRIGNWITVNGDGAWSRAFPKGTRLRLRLVNTANARVFTLETRGFDGWVVALDGMPLDRPQRLAQLSLAPAQRIDLIVDLVAEPGEEAFLVSMERDAGYAIAAFPVAGSVQTAQRPVPGPLPPNPVPALGDLTNARTAELQMQGGAMGGMTSARMGDREMEPRDLAAAGKVWAFNGRADMATAPLIEADRGETIRIAMKNDTSWAHAMHLHGHHFRQIRPDGSRGPLRDTLLMARGERVEIAFVADNPGDWLLHCHMLEHAAAGMMTWLRVL